jgi:hypothetical protein
MKSSKFENSAGIISRGSDLGVGYLGIREEQEGNEDRKIIHYVKKRDKED